MPVFAASAPSGSTGYTIGGYITRTNMSPALSNLDIQADPYWTLLGDTSDDSTISTSPGVNPALSVHKKVWADSAYVAGRQLMLATPDNSTLDLRLLVDGVSMADVQTKLATIIEAVTRQITFQVILQFDSAYYGWSCYTADYQVGFAQVHYFGLLAPLYLMMDRDPTPVQGPI